MLCAKYLLVYVNNSRNLCITEKKDDSDIDDAEYFRQEVGEAPDAGKIIMLLMLA